MSAGIDILSGEYLNVPNFSSGGGGTTPTGPAGGDLAGSYPNPTLGLSGVTPGSYLDGTFFVDSKGRITSFTAAQPAWRANGNTVATGTWFGTINAEPLLLRTNSVQRVSFSGSATDSVLSLSGSSINEINSASGVLNVVSPSTLGLTATGATGTYQLTNATSSVIQSSNQLSLQSQSGAVLIGGIGTDTSMFGPLVGAPTTITVDTAYLSNTLPGTIFINNNVSIVTLTLPTTGSLRGTMVLVRSSAFAGHRINYNDASGAQTYILQPQEIVRLICTQGIPSQWQIVGTNSGALTTQVQTVAQVAETIANGVGKYIYDPPGLTASLTLTLPQNNCVLYFNKAVTALVVNPSSGATMISALTAVSAIPGDTYVYSYTPSITTHIRELA